MEGGLEGAWRGQRDRGRGAYPQGWEGGQNKLGERGGICFHVKEISQSEHAARLKSTQGNAAQAKGA